MTLYDIYLIMKNHEGISIASVVFLLLVLSKLISVSKLNLDPWGFLKSIPGKIGKVLTADLHEQIETLSKSVSDLTITSKDERKRNLRKSILRFADECRIGQKHSKEMFDTTLMEISEYEELCKDTGDPNHVISEAISVIIEINHECFLNDTYL